MTDKSDMSKKLKTKLSAREYHDKIYEVAKEILPSVYQKVDPKYMELESTFVRTSFTALGIAEVFLQELGFVCDSVPQAPRADEPTTPVIEFEQETNPTNINRDILDKLKKASGQK